MNLDCEGSPFIKCPRCGGKYQPPGSPLHIDSACDCAEMDELEAKYRRYKEARAEWKEVESRRNRRTFTVGG